MERVLDNNGEIDIEKIRERLVQQKVKQAANKKKFDENTKEVIAIQKAKGAKLEEAINRSKKSNGCSIS